MFTAFLIIIILYTILIGSFIVGYNKVAIFSTSNSEEKTGFSVVIPFRNEAKNLSELLQSIQELNYPETLFEVILVNDESEDHSVSIIDTFISKSALNLRVINNKRFSNSPKKDAITIAINQSKFNWIVTTDADCKLPKNWLQNFNAFILKNNPNMIIAPVNYTIENSVLQGFQLMDFWSLQTATIGSFGIKKPFLSNGANLAYKKSIFNQIDGFKNNNTIASGDDFFALENFLKLDKSKVQYLKSKDSIVTTKTQPNWNALFMQRVRWASKSSAYKSSFAKLVGLLVLLANAIIIVAFFMMLLSTFSIKNFLFLFSLKFVIDLIAIYKSAAFFQQKHYLIHFIVSSFLYPIFSVLVVIYSQFFNYKWKGRYFKR